MVSSSAQTDSPELRAKQQTAQPTRPTTSTSESLFHSLGAAASPSRDAVVNDASKAASIGGFAIAGAAAARPSVDIREPYNPISNARLPVPSPTQVLSSSYSSPYSPVQPQKEHRQKQLEQAAIDQAAAAMQATAKAAGAAAQTDSLPGAKFTKSQTFVIFDWDDTLLPSFWIAQNGLRLEEDFVIPDHLAATLRNTEILAEQLLVKASRHGQVCIITNAETGWIELSCRKYLPGLGKELFSGKYNIRSARSENERPGDPDSTPFGWKCKSFIAESRKYFDQFELLPGKQRTVVSFGDSAHEREALLHIGKVLGSDYVCKTVKFMERPSCATLQTQQKMMMGSLDRIIQMPAPLDLQIKAPPPVQP